MEALDTNFVLRLLLRDEPRQAGKARSLSEEADAAGNRLLINDIVVCESVWVLHRTFGFSRGQQTEALNELLGDEVFEFEDRQTLERAVQQFAVGRADFADYLIGERNVRFGSATTHTFDSDLSGESGFTLHR